jgi:hypothetical protein
MRLIAGFAAISIACLSASSADAQNARAQAGAGPDIPQSIWEVRPDGSARHLMTDLVCPATAGDFRRTELMVFDNAGLDVGCNFGAGRGEAVTIYLTKRAGQDFAADLTRAQNELTTAYPDARPIAVDVQPALPAVPWLSAMYLFPQYDIHSSIWIADYAGWTLKFRTSYPVQRADVALAAMKELGAASTAAQTNLAACAGSPAPERTGKRIVLTKELTPEAFTAALIAPVMAALPGDTAPLWCAESAVLNPQAPLVLWRNIAAGGPVDRATGISVGPPPLIEISALPPASSKLVSPEGANVYAAGLVRGTTVEFFAFFDGRPSAAAISELILDMVAGKVRPVSSLDRASKNIIVNTPSGASSAATPAPASP